MIGINKNYTIQFIIKSRKAKIPNDKSNIGKLFFSLLETKCLAWASFFFLSNSKINFT